MENVEKDDKKVTRTEFNHLIGSQAGNIDEFLLKMTKPMTIKAIAEKMKLSTARVKSHVNHLIGPKQKRTFTIDEEAKTYLLVYESEKGE